MFRLIKLEPTECWFGYIFTKNLADSEHREELTPKFVGLEVFGRLPQNSHKICVQIPPKGDDTIILRRFHGNCNFELTSKIIK